MTQVRAYYRSRVTPFSFILSGLFVAFVFSPWGPRQWRDTPSLRLIHVLLPWPLVFVIFLVYVVLLATRRLGCAVLAAAIGLAMYGMGFVALIVTLRPYNPTNPLAIAGVFLACVLHYLALRLAIIQQEAT